MGPHCLRIGLSAGPGCRPAVFIEPDGRNAKRNAARVREGLKAAFEKAVHEWIGMKKTEGNALQKDIASHLLAIETKLKAAEELLPRATSELRERLKLRLHEVSKDVAVNEERVMREVVVMSEKSWDVNEEIIRIKSHISQFRKTMDDEKSAIGKTPGFSHPRIASRGEYRGRKGFRSRGDTDRPRDERRCGKNQRTSTKRGIDKVSPHKYL